MSTGVEAVVSIDRELGTVVTQYVLDGEPLLEVHMPPEQAREHAYNQTLMSYRLEGS